MDFKDTDPKRTKWKLKIYLSRIERKYRRYSGNVRQEYKWNQG